MGEGQKRASNGILNEQKNCTRSIKTGKRQKLKAIRQRISVKKGEKTRK
jgi:hypothetical protein